MRNLNPKINPVTTILGTALIVTAIIMFIAPLFVAIKDDLDYRIPSWIGGIGLCLLLIPDDVKGALRKLLARKSGKA